MSKEKYTFEWLDTLIEKLENAPTKNYTQNDGMSLKGIDMMCLVDTELNALKQRIRSEIFEGAFPKKSRKVVANSHHETITYYMNVLYAIGQNNHSTNETVKEICDKLHSRLYLLLDFLEVHFREYLKSNRKVPKHYLCLAKRNLRELLGAINARSKTVHCPHTLSVIRIVREALEKFINRSSHPYIVTYQCVQYRLELLKKIQALPQWEAQKEIGLCPLNSLLIFMNFNSKSYINYLTSCLSQSTENSHDSGKIELLLGHYKEFRQLHTDPNSAFNPEYHSIVDVLNKWFDEELTYFSKMVSLAKVTVGESKKTTLVNQKPLTAGNKVLCTLSGDQIALLLRAADEVHMLSARSLTAVFRNIIPHIATKQKDELSYESIRTKSYNAEQTDKDVTIRTLQRMIEKIQNY